MIKQFRYIFNRKQKAGLLLLLIAIIVGTFLELAGVTAIMPFIDVVMNPETIDRKWYLKIPYESLNFQNTTVFIIFVAVVLIAVYILKNVYLCFMYYAQYRFTYDNRRKVATRMLNAYLKQPYSYHRIHPSSELMRNISTDTERMFDCVLSILQLFTEGCVCVVLVVYLFIMDKSITIGVGAILSLFVLVFYRGFKKYLNYVGNENRKYAARITQWLQQSFGGIKEAKILEREDYFLNQFDYNYKKSASYDRKYRFLQVAPRPIMEMVFVAAILAVIIVKLLNGTQSAYFVSTLSVFAIAAFRLMPSMNRITNYMSVLMFTKGSVEKVYHDLQEVERLEKNKPMETADVSLELKKEIQIRNLSFRYPDASENVLENISFTIPKNRSIAFIGPSGAGKTTLADIILGVLEPTAGQICVDGIDIQNCMSAWHKNIGYIPQSIYLMDASIRENVAFGIPEEQIDETCLRRALEEAQLKEFVDSLPEGLDTVIGESGVRLSGGQRQRIGIARALYNDPDVLVLDEATSALDNETEKAVMDAIDRLAGNKTLIIIAHRLTTITNCDVIYEVKDRQIKRVTLGYDSAK